MTPSALITPRSPPSLRALGSIGIGVLLSVGAPQVAEAGPVSVGAALHGDLRFANPDQGLDGEPWAGPMDQLSTSGGAAPGVGLAVPVRIHLSDLAALRLETGLDYTRGDMAMVVRQGAPVVWTAGGGTPTATSPGTQAPSPYVWEADRAFRIDASGLLVSEKIGVEMMLAPAAPVVPYLHGGVGVGLLTLWPRDFDQYGLADYYQAPDGAPVGGDLACAVRANCAESGFNEVKVVTPTGLVSLGAGVAAVDKMVRIELAYVRGRTSALYLNRSGGDPATTQPYALGSAFQLLQLSAGVAFGG